MVHVFKTILLVLITNHLIAATYTTIGSGSWTDNALWLGGVAPPTNASNNEIITIESAHTVTFIGNLVFQNNCSITILGNLFIEGSFEADNNYTTNISGHLLVTGNFTIKNNANIDVDGSLTIYGDFTGNNGNVLIGDGEVSVHGTMNGINDTGFVGTVSENMVGWCSSSNQCQQ